MDGKGEEKVNMTPTTSETSNAPRFGLQDARGGSVDMEHEDKSAYAVAWMHRHDQPDNQATSE